MIAFKLALRNVVLIFGRDIAANVERIYRLETNHFKSRQYLGTYSAGMEKFGDKYPYGWKTIDRIVWSINSEYKPVGAMVYSEGITEILKYFLKFPNVNAAVMTLAAFLNYYANNAGRWFSTDPDSQKKYNAKIAKIATIFLNQIQ